MHECLLRYQLLEKDIAKLYDNDCTAKEIGWTFDSISARLRASKKSLTQDKYLIFVLLASHGILIDGMTMIAINQFDKKKEYYKLNNTEAKIRHWAEIYPNAYIICIFACCRQLYQKDIMTGYSFEELQA